VQPCGDPGRLELGGVLPERCEQRVAAAPVLGAGRPSDLLFGAAPAVGFDLTDTTTLSDGIVILSYQTDKTLPRAA
jgi:hypothetical protein